MPPAGWCTGSGDTYIQTTCIQYNCMLSKPGRHSLITALVAKYIIMRHICILQLPRRLQSVLKDQRPGMRLAIEWFLLLPIF
jgi:hypothetical protein